MNGQREPDMTTRKGTHTPGPLSTDDEGFANGSYVAIRDAKGRWLGSAHGDHSASGADPDRFPSNDEAYANAELWASAPDLLAALKTCEAELVTLKARLSEPYRRNVAAACDLARAAILKAEGGAL